MKQHSVKEKQSLFTDDKNLGGYKQMQGGLHVFRLTLKPCGYKRRGVMVAGPGCILSFHSGPLHHCL
jgi:hypothetical protein